MIDGTVIVNHMTDAAPHSLVVLDSCMGMKNDLFCAPLLGRGVSVVFGYSETHTCYSASEKQTAFFQHLFQGETVGEAFGHMQQEAGLWDSVYMHYTLEQAMESDVAFPVIASEEDAYPGEGNVNKPQTVKSGWRLPVRTDILRKITVPYKEELEPRVILANCKSAKIVGSGKLPEGLHYGVSGDGLLYLQGKATEKGYRPVAFETVSSNGFTMPVMTVGIMVADYGHATVLPTVEDTITAEDLGYGPSHEDFCMVNEPGYYLKILDFHSEPVSTYAIEKHSGALPYTLEFGTTEYSGTGYIKSAQIWSQAYYEGSYYATPPGRYDVTLDLITYPKGDVYRLPFRLTVNAARTITDYNVTTEFEKGFTYRRRLFNDLENYYVTQMEITGGSLPKGVRLLNGPDHDVELYGTPEETGDFTASYRITGYNQIYEGKIKIKVKESPKVKEVHVTGLKIPKAGETCMDLSDLSVPAGSHYKVQIFNWYNWETNQLILTPFQFEAGKTYNVWMRITAESGYTFSPDIGKDPEKDDLTLNGGTGLMESVSSNVFEIAVRSVPLAVPEAGHEIREVRITGFAEPKAGEAATEVSALSVPGGAHYALEELRWYDGADDQEIAQPFSFEAGKSYYAKMKIRAGDKYAFAFDGTQTPDFDEFTLNGGGTLISEVRTLSGIECEARTVTFTGSAPAPAQAYSFTKGDGSVWTKGSGAALDFTIKGTPDDSVTYGRFTNFTVDGFMVASGDYSATAGSVELSLKSSYLESLPEGEHVLRAEFSDGTAEAKFTVKAAPAPAQAYSFTKGDGSVWTKGSGETLDFTIKGSPDDTVTYGRFTNFTVDGFMVASGDYSATAGSVELSLKSGYLEGLPEGEHLLRAEFTDGTCEAKFTVKAASAPKDPTDYDDVAVPGGSFTFTKVWQGGSEGSIDFTLYRQGGAVYRHGFDKTVVSQTEWRYSAWFREPAACYVIEKPVPGYRTRYENVGIYAGITDRCCDGGTIVNYRVPKTGDSGSPALWLGCVLAGLGMLALAYAGKRKKAGGR